MASSSKDQCTSDFLKWDMSRLKDDHIILLDLTLPNRTPQQLAQDYIHTLDAMGRVAALGGAIVGGLKSTVDVLSVLHFPGRFELYRGFPLVFILRILYRIGGEITQFDFAITKGDAYLFAYKVGETGTWKNCTGIDYKVEGSEKSGFSVSYCKDEAKVTSMLGLPMIFRALEGLSQGVPEKSALFHVLCVHFGEAVRYKNIRDEILPCIESQDTGLLSAQSKLCINCWSDFSDCWRSIVYKDLSEKTWKVPDKVKMCIQPFPPKGTHESVTEFENRVQDKLRDWIQGNLLLLKSEKNTIRFVRTNFYVPKLINPPKQARKDSRIRNRTALDNLRNDFWEARIQESHGNLLKIGIWKTLRQIANLASLNHKETAQLMIDHSDLEFSKVNLLECKDLIENNYELPEYLFANPTNLR